MKKLIVVIGLILMLLMPVVSPMEGMQRMANRMLVPSQEASGGPIIQWYGLENETIAIAWDGAYTGQTEEVWSYSVWVNDTDGVSTVLFRYLWMGETEWMNRTARRISGDTINGRYTGNLTYAVWWNETSGYPETEGSGGNFYFKIWANDTLGNWSETSSIAYMGGYWYVSRPSTLTPTDITEFFRSPLGISMTIAAVSCFVVAVILMWMRRSGR